MSDYRELIKEAEENVPRDLGDWANLASNLLAALRSVLDEQAAVKAEAWDEGFDAAEKDIMDHDANRWQNECVPNPYRRALTGGETE